MAQRAHTSVRPYLAHALIATVAVVGAPVVAIVAWLLLAEPNAGFVPALVLGGLVTLFVFATGATLWKRRPESADISFGELMIWGWIQRKRADDRLQQGADLLGLDRSGQPAKPVRITLERQLEVLHELTDALESKDPYTHGHSQRVERHAYRTAVTMGLPASAIEELRRAAALHDVGKIRIPDRILRKPGQLTIEERAIVEEHVVVGAWMVSSVSSADVVSAVRHHHERWDGQGYPDGLAGTDIPLYSRMIAVADAYDAITSTRPYRVSSGREHAVEILEKHAGTQFDPMIVTAFVEALPVRLPVAGMLVLLAGPGALWRRVAVWLKRTGAGNLAPTAATLGAIVTLGTFIPSLPTPAQPVPALAAPQVEVETDDGTTENKVAVQRIRPEAPARAASGTGVAASEAAAAAGAPDDTIVLADDLAKDTARPAHDPEPEPDSKRDQDPAADDEPVAADDQSGNKNDGRDGCPRDGDAGEGNDSECGAESPGDEQAAREDEGRDEDDDDDPDDDSPDDDDSGSDSERSDSN